MTNPLDKILRPVTDKIVRAVSGSSDKALPLLLGRAQMTRSFIEDEANRVADQMIGKHVTSGKAGDTKNLSGRSMKEADRLKGLTYELKPTGTVAKAKIYVPRKGDVKIAVPGDQTVSDKTLVSVNGQPIDSEQQGGAYYGLGQKHLDVPEFWKSNQRPAEMLQAKVDRLEEFYGPNRIIGSHLAMGQKSNNFAMHLADANLRAVDWSSVTPSNIYAFDRLIAKGYKDSVTGEQVTFPNWPGLADPEASMAAMKEDTALRKFFNNRFKTPNVTQPLGLPNGLDIQYAISEPRIRDMEINMTGLMTGKLVPGAKAEAAGNPHNTYTHRIEGEAIGPQEVLTPFSIDFPDSTEHIFSTGRIKDFTGTIQKVFPHQIVDDQYLDDFGIYRDRIKKLTGQKKGGAVSQDAMNLAVMNQKVQRKMGGGGAKSKNAPKFTEAFTQGLGPMLYGAARGTAAGLAGIGGDIEELARLGINYAGDKLQGRFPNMLDKKDVVGAKATLPTSERVLSKIPSLKDFGAGPEARHSEDIAAKLGMYGLSNIAAPKVGKAVVQGVNATGKALAPKAGEMLENYMVRTGGILPMDVWHGSPHRMAPTPKNPLGEFDATKIGTGEGAQAFGYGHYLAEVRDLAKTYQPRSPLHEEKLIKEYNRAQVKSNYPKMEVLEDAMLHKSPDEILAKFSNIEDGYTPEHAKAANEYLLWLGKNQPEVGALYKVDLPDAQIAKMLDWDKPLSQQPPSLGIPALKALEAQQQSILSQLVPLENSGKQMTPEGNALRAQLDGIAQAVNRYHVGNRTGGDYYTRLALEMGSPKKASEALMQSGIPGIRYLDQGSRDAGEGTRNFVVFPGNEEMLNILSREKDGGLVHGKKNGGAIHMAKGSDKEDFEVTLKRLGLGSTKPLPGLSLDTKLPLPYTPSVLRVGGERKPNYYSYQDRADAAGSTLYPFPEEMEAAKRPATVNPLMQRQALRRSPDTPQNPIEPEEQTYTDSDRSFTPSPSPTFRQNRAAEIQRLLQDADSPKPRARSLAESIMGVGGTGIADFVPYLGTGMAWQEGIRNIQEANRRGDTAGALGEAALMSAMTAIGIGPALKLANHLAGKLPSVKQVHMSKAEYNRIARENAPKQLSAPELQRLLNAPPEKTVFEMQQEIAQKNAMLPKSQYGLELPPGNTAAQRLAAMGFDTPAYHSTKQDPTVLLPRPPASSRRGTDFGVHVGLNPETANGAIIPPWYEKTMRDQATRADLPASIRGESLKDIENYYKDSQVMPLLVNTGKSLEMPDLGRWNSPNNMLHNIGSSSGVWPNYSLKKGVKTNDPDALDELIKSAGQAEGEKLFSEVKDELHKKAIEDMLRKRGYGSIAYPNTVEGKGDISLMFTDPDRLRSRFAAGDPFRRNAAIAAATGSVAPDLLAEEYANGGEVTSDDLILIERRR